MVKRIKTRDAPLQSYVIPLLTTQWNCMTLWDFHETNPLDMEDGFFNQTHETLIILSFE